MKFGLMFFAASEDSLGPDKYRLVVDSARFGDAAGFSSVWVPERHFTGFGGLYPNPAVLHAGLATCTQHIRLNAGSVVAPLHHPVRIAEDWSVVDNLSNGRVGLSFASGWNPDDFIFYPERYATRNDHLLDVMQQVQRLWRGDAFEGTNGVGKPARVTIYPKPVQAELPVWLTVAGNPRNFERAGACGAHLLTHLLDQDEATLASKIAIYRDARAAAGFDPSTGIVSLMIHTLVGSDAALVREQARRPYCNYIKANIGLFKGLEQSRGREVDLSSMSEADLDEFTNFLYDRFAASRGLIGTPESCAPLVSRLEQIGVTELACLLDFGPDVDLILTNLPHLARLKDLHANVVTPVVSTGPSTGGFDRAVVLARCANVTPGLWRRDGEALAQLVLQAPARGYQVNPASLDACGQVLAAALSEPRPDGAAGYVAQGFDACDLPGPVAGSVWVHATTTGQPRGSASGVTGNVDVYSESGQVLARLVGLRLHRAASAAPGTAVAEGDQWLYERAWKATKATTQPPPVSDARGRWLVIADATGVAAELMQGIEEHGGTCVTSADSSLRGIVYLRGLDSGVGPDVGPEALDRSVDHAVRGAMVAAQTHGSTPLWIVTRGAVPVLGEAEAVNVTQAPLWGLGRALAVEQSGALGALVDLDPAASADESARQVLEMLTGDTSEDMVAYRAGVRYVPRLRRTVTVAPDTSALTFTSDDTVLITGGTGGLGLRLAEWLAQRGARHIVLCGRRRPLDSTEARLQRLRASGVDVTTWAVDVADNTALQALFDQSSLARPPVTSIFHLAGVLDDGRIGEQTWERFAGVFASKVTGAWNLHQLTRGTTLKHFVMFSSVSSLLPAPGQSSYAAANAFLDGLAHHRRSQGLSALAVNWGPWSEVGHAETEYGRQAHAHLASLGIGSMAPGRALRVLEGLLLEARAQVAVVPVDWARLCSADPAAARLGLLADLVVTPAAPTSAAAPATRPATSSALVDALVALPVDERRPHLLHFLSEMVIAALKLRTDEPLDARKPLFDIGLDSIMALELKDRLERAVGVPLSATLLFVHPTLDALCDHILGSMIPAAPPAPLPDDGPSEEELTRQLLREIGASRGT